MYIETRTTHTEVFEDIHRHINYLCNSLIDSARQRITFPSTIRKTDLREKEQQLQGAVSLARLVIQEGYGTGGDSPFPNQLALKIRETHEIVEKALMVQ